MVAHNLARDGKLPLPPEPEAGGGGASGGETVIAGGGEGGSGGDGGGGSDLPALPPGLDRGVAAVHGLVLRVACCPLPGLRVRLQLPGLAAAAAAADIGGATDDRWGRR